MPNKLPTIIAAVSTFILLPTAMFPFPSREFNEQATKVFRQQSIYV